MGDAFVRAKVGIGGSVCVFVRNGESACDLQRKGCTVSFGRLLWIAARCCHPLAQLTVALSTLSDRWSTQTFAPHATLEAAPETVAFLPLGIGEWPHCNA